MVVAGAHHEVDLVAGRAGRVGVGGGHLDRHALVGVAVDDEDRDAGGQPLDRRGVGVGVRDLVGVAAQEARRGTLAEVEAVGLAEVEDAGLGDDAGEPHPRLGARGGPERELATRGVADGHDPVAVDGRVDLGQIIDPGGDVLSRHRPASAADLADAAELDVPRRDAPAHEVAGEIVGELERVLLTPEAAVHEDRDRERAVAVGHEQIAELVEMGSVAVAHTMPRSMAQAPKTWILTGSPENFAATRERGFRLIGMKERRRNQALAMAPGDRIVFYLTQVGRFAGSALITGELFEDRTPVWPGKPGNPDSYPWRFPTEPEVVLDDGDQVPAESLKDELEHVRKWPPEHWRLAFQGQLRTVSDADAELLLDRLRAAAGVPA